ncbi:MAG: YchF-related putative GTPase [Candidatus Bathyarchaeota archaeon]|nr:YchF-related putative GTPase [Candidatus Bathyarchaeota archaeon]
MIRIGLIGKTNAGKTTFFNSATLLSSKISTYPFTTKRPNTGTAYVKSLCVCKELDIKDNPKNSACVDGWRFIPIEIIDLPGLIKGSWRGKGLGTQFLSVASQADALLHIVDASGSIDAEGKITKPGMGNPILDVYDIEEELIMWFTNLVKRNSKTIEKNVKKGVSLDNALFNLLAGLKVKYEHVKDALEDIKLDDENISKWNDEDIKLFARRIRELSKPTIIIANKMDLPYASDNYDKLVEEFKDVFVTPSCSEAELALRRAEEKGYIKYIPGEEKFEVLNKEGLTKDQIRALNYVQQRVLSKWISTGVQFALNVCVFKLLGMNSVYPVEDSKNLSDKKGNILPDVLLIPNDADILYLASEIHTELAKNIVYAIDARTSLRLPTDYTIKDRDIISIISALRKSKGHK